MIRQQTRENVYTVISAMTFAVFFFAVLNAVHDEPPAPVQMVKADERLMDCLPADTGSRVIMTLVSHDDELTLRCEHHQNVGRGHVPTEKPRYVSLTVPVDVN